MGAENLKKTGKQPKESGKLILELLWLGAVSLPIIIWSIIQKFLPQNKKSLKGETVLITGAGNGLGREIAFKMANRGCKLALVDINEECVVQAAKDIKQRFGNIAKSYVANLGKPQDIKQLSKEIMTDFERVDILVNNAGVVYGGGTILDSKDRDIESMFQINVISQFRMIREFLGGMLKRNHGHIVAISSSSSYVGLANASVYTSTKWAINGMMETLRQELRAIPDNQVKSTTITPYFIKTNTHYTDKWDLRLPAMSMHTAAEAVVDGIERDEEEFSIPSHLYMSLITLKLLPRTLKDMVISIFYTRVLPTTETERDTHINVKILDSLREEVKL